VAAEVCEVFVALEAVADRAAGMVSMPEVLERIRTRMIQQAVRSSDNLSEAARKLGISRQAVDQAVRQAMTKRSRTRA
jgi:ActR/RegA family two-component response regulator